MMSGAGLAVLGSSPSEASAAPRPDPLMQTTSQKRSTVLGTTFSQLQCYYMDLDYRETFAQIAELGFNRIRLCSYWHEIEPIEDQFNFSQLDWLLDESHKRGIEVVLAVGMKVPRWPEYHFPDWFKDRYDTAQKTVALDRNPEIADRTLRFVERVMHHARSAPAVKYWQIENEPFAQMEITGGRFLSHAFVRKEVEFARSLMLPEQKLVLTTAITLPASQLREDDRAFKQSLQLADIVGVNVYTKVPVGNSSFYIEPMPAFWRKLRSWQASLVNNGKEAWVSEAQAEPWEPNELVAMSRIQNPSCSPDRVTTLVGRLSDIGFSSVLLWGYEYWYWHKKNGREEWWQTVQKLMQG